MMLQEIHRKLDRLQLAFRTLCVASGSINFFVAIGGLAIVSFGLDFFIQPPVGVRAAVLLGFLIALFMVFRNRILFPLRMSIGSEDMARQVELHNPFLENRLVSALQFERLMGQTDYADSSAMSEAVMREVRLLGCNIEYFKILKPMRVIAFGLIPVLLHGVLAMGAVRFPNEFKIWFARNLLLWEVDWPQKTQVDLVVNSFSFENGKAPQIEVDGARSDFRVTIVSGFLEEDRSLWKRISLTQSRPRTNGKPPTRYGTIDSPRDGEYFFIETSPKGDPGWLDQQEEIERSGYYRLREGTQSEIVGIHLPNREILASADRNLVLNAVVEGEQPENVMGWIEYQDSLRSEQVQFVAQKREIFRGLNKVLHQLNDIFARHPKGDTRAERVRELLLALIKDPAQQKRIEDTIPKLLMTDDLEEEVLLELEEFCHELGIKRQESDWMDTGIFQTEIDRINLQGDFVLHLTGGDDRDKEPSYRIRVKIPPRVSNPIIWVDYPTYTGRIDRNRRQYLEALQNLSDEKARLNNRTPSEAEKGRIDEIQAGVKRFREAMRSSGTIECPVGSTVHLETSSKQQLQSNGRIVFSSEKIPARVMKLSSDEMPGLGQIVGNIPIVDEMAVREELQFRLEVFGRNGLKNTDPVLHRLRIIPDRKPRFKNVTPTSKSLRRVGLSRIGISVRVVDDYGVGQVELLYWVGNDRKKDEQRVVLFQGNDKDSQAEVEVQHLLELENLRMVVRNRISESTRPLEPGDRVRFLIVARDLRRIDIGKIKLGPQTGQVGPYEILIIDKSEIIDRANRLIHNLKEKIRLLRDSQNEIFGNTNDLGESLKKLNSLSEGDRKEIEKLELEQNRRITAEAITIGNGFERILDDFRLNNILEDKPRNLDEIREILQEVSEKLSPVAESNLRQARESKDPKNSSEFTVKSAAIEGIIVQNLDKLLGLLEEWENYNEIIRAWRELKTRQDKIKDKTSKSFR